MTLARSSELPSHERENLVHARLSVVKCIFKCDLCNS